MMLFQRNTEYVRNFLVSTSSGQNNPIAYGPGSIINGSLMITLDDKPLSAHSIRVIFKCEEQDNARNTTTIFSIESVIWGKPGADPQELSNGSHMFLFAIRLPQVNYPPSMHDSPFGHRISYTLQGVFDTTGTTHVTATVPIIYLPLVTCSPNTLNETSKKTQVFEKEDKKIEVTAELIKPAYCPGDLCTVKMTTNNKSDTKISSIQVLLAAVATTLPPTDSVSAPYQHKQHTLLTESFYVSIAKQAQNHQDIFTFTIPSNIVPTFTNKLGKYIDIAYEVIIVMGSASNTGSWFSGYVSNEISLPITIATVPPAYPIGFTVHENTETELPTFIPNIESPLPSPVHYPADRAYSVSPSNSFQIKDDLDDDDDFCLNRQDASGHLMVPDNARRISNSSDMSDATLAANTLSRLETVSH
ncbi:hypothetical protein BDF21DRAFT_410170 [Thamnidium elegans]|nr:hypothetical protein BDF21DRAFT_410170 [Thamnidium elegans]